MLQANASLNEILLRTESQQSLTASPKDVQKAERGLAKVEGVARSRVGDGGVDTTAKQKRNYRKPISMTTTAAVGRKRTNQKVVDRRRRRGQRLSSGSSEESEGEERGRSGDSSSDSSLSMPSDGESGEDIQVLESLSDSSASEDERPPQPTLPPPQPQQRKSFQGGSTNQITSSPGPSHLVSVTNQASRQDTNGTSSTPATDSGKPLASQRGRRQIVLAASFNLAPSSSSAVDDPSHASASDISNTARITSSDASLAQAMTIGDSCDAGDAGEDGDRLLKEVYCDAVESSCVHTACSILAEDTYLTPIKVFADWLQTYSIVLASASKQVGSVWNCVSLSLHAVMGVFYFIFQISSSLWSNLASVLNLLPTEDQLLRASKSHDYTPTPPHTYISTHTHTHTQRKQNKS